MLIIARVDGGTGLPWFVVGSTVLNLGLGAIFTVTLELVVSAAPHEHAGVASGLAEAGTLDRFVGAFAYPTTTS